MERKEPRKVTFSLTLYVIILGWIGALAYTLLLMEHNSFQQVLNYFLSVEENGVRFRALVFFFPLLATLVGYLVHEREKYFHRLLIQNREVEKAGAQLEEMIRQKDQFIIRLGHDLKTPLTPLVTLLHIIRNRENDPQQCKLLDASVDNVNILKELVIKSLKLARVKSSRELKLEPVLLKPEVDVFIGKRQFLLDEKDLKIQNMVGEDVTVQVDRVELEELFYNLISNAIKYSPPSAEILIKGERRGEFADICVVDYGIGLTEAQAGHVFDEFYKVDESRHQLDASGLGLSICKYIVRNHGGSIRAISEGLGKGTTINVTLPVSSQ